MIKMSKLRAGPREKWKKDRRAQETPKMATMKSPRINPCGSVSALPKYLCTSHPIIPSNGISVSSWMALLTEKKILAITMVVGWVAAVWRRKVEYNLFLIAGSNSNDRLGMKLVEPSVERTSR